MPLQEFRNISMRFIDFLDFHREFSIPCEWFFNTLRLYGQVFSLKGQVSEGKRIFRHGERTKLWAEIYPV